MADAQAARLHDDCKRAADNTAAAAYAAAEGSLSRLVERSAVAADAWSELVRTSVGEDMRKAAAAASESSAERRGAAEKLLKGCCRDGDGRVDVVPGTWSGEIAAGAEGMASLAGRAAARWSARGAPLSAPAESPVLAELAVSEAWLSFADYVAIAERAAEGTRLGARPVDELAAAAAQKAEHDARAEGADAEAAGRLAAAAVRGHAAREAAESAAILRGAVDAWTEASAEWSRARDLAVGEGDQEVARMAAEQAGSAGEHAARLRAASG